MACCIVVLRMYFSRQNGFFHILCFKLIMWATLFHACMQRGAICRLSTFVRKSEALRLIGIFHKRKDTWETSYCECHYKPKGDFYAALNWISRLPLAAPKSPMNTLNQWVRVCCTPLHIAGGTITTSKYRGASVETTLSKFLAPSSGFGSQKDFRQL